MVAMCAGNGGSCQGRSVYGLRWRLPLQHRAGLCPAAPHQAHPHEGKSSCPPRCVVTSHVLFSRACPTFSRTWPKHYTAHIWRKAWLVVCKCVSTYFLLGLEGAVWHHLNLSCNLNSMSYACQAASISLKMARALVQAIKGLGLAKHAGNISSDEVFTIQVSCRGACWALRER